MPLAATWLFLFTACAPSQFNPPKLPVQSLTNEEGSQVVGNQYQPQQEATESLSLAFQLAFEGRLQATNFPELNIKAALEFLRYAGEKLSGSALAELCHSVSRQMQTGTRCDETQVQAFSRASFLLLMSLEADPSGNLYSLKKDANLIFESVGITDRKKMRELVDKIRLGSNQLAYLLTFFATSVKQVNFNSNSNQD